MAAQPAPMGDLTLGSVRMTFVPDGSICLPAPPLWDGATPQFFDANSHLLDDDGMLVMSMGSLLVESAGRRILIDLSWGPGTVDISAVTGGRRGGRIIGGSMLDNLARRGVQPEDIDVVVFSHLHGDHIGWLTRETSDGPRLTFPRAEHRLAADEWEYWQLPENQNLWGGPSEAQLTALGTQMGHLDDGDLIAPGVNVMLTPGHTPGHASFVISSESERAIVLGDTVHCPLEISHPELELISDVDREMGKTTRTRILRELDADGAIAVGAHFPERVFGRVINSPFGRQLDYVA